VRAVLSEIGKSKWKIINGNHALAEAALTLSPKKGENDRVRSFLLLLCVLPFSSVRPFA
jgi:hypothetical protein